MESPFQKVYANQEIIIGRDPNRCQHVVNDPVVSNRHLRIYTIIFDADQSDGTAPLVYAEDMSRNGTYWNGSLIGKGSGGVLLSDGDTLRLSPRIYYHFYPSTSRTGEPSFDVTQEFEMKHFEKEYNISERKLGSGACGEVYMAIEQSRHTQLACKIVDLRKLKGPPHANSSIQESAVAAGDVDSRLQMAKIKSWAQRKQRDNRVDQQLRACHREASILASLSHPNIIGIEKVYITDNSIYIFQDLITGGDLFSFLERNNGKLSDVEAAVIVRQILIALEYLHDQNIVHRDLKPENILMTSLANGCRVVLTDFGHAKKIDNDLTRMTTMAGTEQYIAPEISGRNGHCKGKNGYTKAVDMWSLGCVTVVLLTGMSPFVSQRTNRYCQKLAQRCDLQQLENVAEWHLVGRRPKDFIKQLLVLDEEQRMSANDAKKHCWFSNDFHRLDFEEVYDRAIKHWRPRTLKTPVVQMMGVEQSKKLPTLQKSDLGQRNSRKRSLAPIDPPYKPYPRRMSLSLLPKRRSTLSVTMSDEIRTAIREKWSPERMRGQVSSAGGDTGPALIPDTEATELNLSQNGQVAADVPNTSANQRPAPFSTSAFMPLAPNPVSQNQTRIIKENKASRVAANGEGASLPVKEASYSSLLPTGPSNPRGSSHISEEPISQSPTRDSLGNKSTLNTVETTVIKDTNVHIIEDAETKDNGVGSDQTTGGITAKMIPDLPVHHPSQQANPRAGEQAPHVWGYWQKSREGAHLSAENINLNTTFEARPDVHAYPTTLRREDRPAKLRSPMRNRLDTMSRRTPNMKRKRGSIFEFDPDEGPEQGQYGLGGLAVDCHSTTFRPKIVWKKSRSNAMNSIIEEPS